AANMIGVRKNIIIVSMGVLDMVMVNPKITKKLKPYETEEGCLSLEGTRKITRYKKIEVEFEDINFVKQKREYKDMVAQIIQHEIDHCNGIII
ncbi:MAG: peptide deformylase, partial [Clostridia bacterium]|nr:peptide deformylase [Clostridia bacterium]